MDPDLAAQPTDNDIAFVSRYKLVHQANQKAVYTAENALNSRLDDPRIKRYIKELYKNYQGILANLKKYKVDITSIDGPQVDLEDSSTYPIYYSLLSPDNQAKIPLFENSLKEFANSYKMSHELANSIATGKSRRRRRKRRTRRY